MTGNQALLYVQDRLHTGDGSDIGRMKLQQAFLASMMESAVSFGTLANPLRLFAVLDKATSALVTDPELAQLSNLVQLAMELRGLRGHDVHFFTMRIAAYPPDANRLASGAGTDALWEQLRDDEVVDARFTDQGASAVGGAAGPPGAAVALLTADYGLCD